MTLFLFIVIAAIIIISFFLSVSSGSSYPLLKKRQADAAVWQLDDIDITITAAYLEIISDSFDICGDEEILKLRPEDSLFELYRSYYRKNKFYDDMELERCGMKFADLCKSPDVPFEPESSLYDHLKLIAKCRNNQPVTDEECAELGIKMNFLQMWR